MRQKQNPLEGDAWLQLARCVETGWHPAQAARWARPTSMALLTKTAIAPETVTTSIRQQLSNIDPDVPLYNLQTLDTYVSQHTEQSRLNVILLGGLGGLALLLAAIGIYGVVS